MTLPSANLPRGVPGTRGWYEVWYLTAWDVPGRNGFWIRYTALSPRDPGRAGECALWFVRTCADHPERNVALKQSLPIERWTSAAGDRFRLNVGDAVLDDGGARGALESGGHKVEWDLAWFSSAGEYRPVPAALRGRAKSDVVVPHWDGRASGKIRVDGEEIALASAPLTQAHIFGTRYSPGWQWAHGAGFAGAPGLVAEALSGRVKVAGLKTPALTTLGCAGAGRRHETGSLLTLLGNRAALEGALPAGAWTGMNALGSLPAGRQTALGPGLTWTVESRGTDADYRWRIRARSLDLAVVEYTGPVGERLNCYNTTRAESVLTVTPRDGGPERTYESRGTTAFEVVVEA